MTDRDVATTTDPVGSVDVDALIRRASVSARSSMPTWVALVLLVSCVLAVNLAASVFRSSTDAFEQAPAPRDAVVRESVREAG